MESAQLIRELGLTDTGKLLVMFEGANRAQISIDEAEVEPLAFLLTARQAVPFGYPFLLNPLPVSTQLRQDLYHLVQSGYLAKGSPIHITRKGSDWVSVLLRQLEAGQDSLHAVAQMLIELIAEYRRHAFDLVYTAISG
jgi:hypothetical protein